MRDAASSSLLSSSRPRHPRVLPGLSVFPTCYPRHTVLLASDNDVLAVDLFLNDDKMLLECRFTEELHVMAGLTIVDTVDCHEEPNHPFSPGAVLSTDIHAKGVGKGLAYDCRGVNDVGGLKERRPGGLDEVGFTQLDVNILDTIAE